MPDQGTKIMPQIPSAPTEAAGEADIREVMDKLRKEQRLGVALAAGLVVSLAGAAVWAGITYATGYQIGFMAIGIGFLVGYTVRATGKGISSVFGVMGAGLSLLGCLAGNLLAFTAVLAQAADVPFFTTLLSLDVDTTLELMETFFNPIDLLFYGLAVYEGYRLSFREVSDEELEGLVTA